MERAERAVEEEAADSERLLLAPEVVERVPVLAPEQRQTRQFVLQHSQLGRHTRLLAPHRAQLRGHARLRLEDVVQLGLCVAQLPPQLSLPEQEGLFRLG